MNISELNKGLEYIKTHNWIKQNDDDDSLTNYIYDTQTFDEVIRIAREKGATESYAVHRWYNFLTSKNVEHIFCENGAVKEEDEKNHNQDFWINGVPFDLKLSVYPAALVKKGLELDLTKRQGKNYLAQWLCENASMEKRYHTGNRIFVVCDGKDYYINYQLKNDVEQITYKVRNYLTYVNKNGFNQIIYNDKNNRKRTVFADVIIIN